MMRHLTIRWRLTLWYGVAMATCLVIFAVAIYTRTERNQAARVEFELHEELDEVRHAVLKKVAEWQLLEELTAEFGRHRTFEFEITRNDGTTFFRSERLGVRRLWTDSRPLPAVTDDRVLPEMGEFRVIRETVDSPHGPLRLHVAIPLASIRAAQRDLVQTLWLVGLLMLLVAGGGGYVLARRALTPVERITATAETITANRLDQRLEVPPVQDELSRLARTLNDMIDRLQHSFDDMRRFTADAAHELRTPLTLLRTQLDVALRSDRSLTEYHEVLVSLREDTVRLCHLASQLLELSREDAGLDAVPFARLRLDEVVLDAVRQIRPMAEQKSLKLDAAELASCGTLGDRDRLQRAFVNVLENAVRYTPHHGCVSIRLRIDPQLAQAIVTIHDTGCGISPEHIPHLFDRFYRVDSARSSSDGTGLGLAISHAILTAHHGRVSLSSTPGQGTAVEIMLPMAS